MQIIIKSKQTHITPQLRERIERKVQRLARFVDEESRMEVTVAEEQTRSVRDRFSVHLALSGNAHPLRSEVSALNASTALDLALDKIVTQIGRQKDRQTTVRRQHTPGVKVLALARSGHLSTVEEDESTGDDHLETSVDEEHNEEMWSRIMEIRRLPTKPMTDQEVIAEMERSGVLFFPFYNEEADSVNVMYKLDKGGYGLLVPVLN